jgi:hypothetical protein
VDTFPGCAKLGQINQPLSCRAQGRAHDYVVLELVMRISGGVVLLVIPIIAILLFGVSVSWDRLQSVDPTFTSSIKHSSQPPALP